MFSSTNKTGRTMESSETKQANDLFRNNEKHLASFLKDDPLAASNLAAGFAHLGYQVVSVRCGQAELKLHLRSV